MSILSYISQRMYRTRRTFILFHFILSWTALFLFLPLYHFYSLAIVHIIVYCHHHICTHCPYYILSFASPTPLLYHTTEYFLSFPDAAVERQKLEIKIQYSSPRPQLNQEIYPFPNATEGQLQTFIIQMIVIKKKELLFGIPRMYPQIVCILPGIGRLGTKWMMQ